LEQIAAQIRQTGYGLTLGVHSCIQATVDSILHQVPVGNSYVNWNMIGAVVWLQPFGGEGLSGTGPKAGGPYTLLRYATERSLSINTAAVGGYVKLLSLNDTEQEVGRLF
jgi:RHH-type proline utilization regulon transcriptional repressor/proline dehydrogenase/delta 1-pyrroline-5-carboxylate dehydrogenase